MKDLTTQKKNEIKENMKKIYGIQGISGMEDKSLKCIR